MSEPEGVPVDVNIEVFDEHTVGWVDPRGKPCHVCGKPSEITINGIAACLVHMDDAFETAIGEQFKAQLRAHREEPT